MLMVTFLKDNLTPVWFIVMLHYLIITFSHCKQLINLSKENTSVCRNVILAEANKTPCRGGLQDLMRQSLVSNFSKPCGLSIFFVSLAF